MKTFKDTVTERLHGHPPLRATMLYHLNHRLFNAWGTAFNVNEDSATAIDKFKKRFQRRKPLVGYCAINGKETQSDKFGKTIIMHTSAAFGRTFKRRIMYHNRKTV